MPHNHSNNNNLQLNQFQSMTKAVTQQNNAAALAVINVPGVRGGVAQPANHGYALGYGGARIPIPGFTGKEAPEAVLPDDSASQVPEREEKQGRGQGQSQSQSQILQGFW